jgi:F0F1-type ATP synthase assembly protein I
MPQSQRDAWSGIGIGWSVVGTLISGLLVCGGLGYLVDRLAGTDGVFVGTGFVVGAAAGVYLVYLRYGREDHGPNDGT